jgi:hypothetical protein
VHAAWALLRATNTFHKCSQKTIDKNLYRKLLERNNFDKKQEQNVHEELWQKFV